MRRQRCHGIFLRPAAKERLEPATLGHPRRTAAGDRHLDRAHLPPPTTATTPRPAHPHRVRTAPRPARNRGLITTPPESTKLGAVPTYQWQDKWFCSIAACISDRLSTNGSTELPPPPYPS